MLENEQWAGFEGRIWKEEINVRDFIQSNYTPYEGDDSFLVGPTDRTKKLWDEVLKLYEKERENGGVLDADTATPSGVNAYEAGLYTYLDADAAGLEVMQLISTTGKLEPETEEKLRHVLEAYTENFLNTRPDK